MSRSRPKRPPGLLRIGVSRFGRLIDALLPRSPGWILALFAMVVVAIAGYQGWRYVVPWVAESPHYQVEPGDIVISQTPPWIRTDIKEKVILDASLDGSMSILDDDLVERVTAAFEFHPWVKEVQRIELSAGPRIDVQLTYRRPVAVVRVAGGSSSEVEYAPVDLEGRRLPGEDMTLAERKAFPLITGMQGLPLVGQTWSDLRVVGAARLADLLANDWKELGLSEIRPEQAEVDTKADLETVLRTTKYVLSRKSGPPIAWYHAPQTNIPGEYADSEKVSMLKAYIRAERSGANPQALDLSRPNAPEHTARENEIIGPK